jgi:hypothetical protein
MKTDARNYGIQREYGPQLEAPRPGVMSLEYERTWSAGPLEHVLEPLYGISRASCGVCDLAGIQRRLADGGQARVEIGLLPGRLAQRHLHWVDRHGRADGDPCRLFARARHGRCDSRTFRTSLLRGVHSLPGRWPSLLVSSRFSGYRHQVGQLQKYEKNQNGEWVSKQD